MATPITPDVFDEPSLLAAPVRRAAYSDRTAWIMSAMSELAYFRFEGGQDFVSLVKDLAQISSASDIESRLRKFLSELEFDAETRRELLAECLKQAGFELVDIYNIADSQAFLARKPTVEGHDGMRILAFRGTEKSFADFKTDLRANLVKPTEGQTDELIHEGFYLAFGTVKKKILEDLSLNPELPLYVTGHSLGGALAIVATRFIAKDSLGACYTFGSPRVGNLDMGLVFRTPIYRIVNSSDVVPRTPPAWILAPTIALLRWIPLPLGWLTRFLERFKGYVHFGDMRYLNHVAEVDGQFPGLRLISNPSLPLRAGWVVRRWISTYGRSGIEDHSISLYRKKLKFYALNRNK